MSFVCRPRSRNDIRHATEVVRSNLKLSDEPYFPVMEVIERVMDQCLGLFEVQVGTASETEGAEGLTDPGGTFLMLREDVYEGAWAGNGRARFTAAHELGHWVLHTNEPMAREKTGEKVAFFRQIEWQANRFAAELLMPASFFSIHDTVEVVMVRHGVSRNAAATRLKCLREEGTLLNQRDPALPGP